MQTTCHALHYVLSSQYLQIKSTNLWKIDITQLAKGQIWNSNCLAPELCSFHCITPTLSTRRSVLPLPAKGFLPGLAHPWLSSSLENVMFQKSIVPWFFFFFQLFLVPILYSCQSWALFLIFLIVLKVILWNQFKFSTQHSNMSFLYF